MVPSTGHTCLFHADALTLGNSTYAGITAVVMANLVLISYIIASVLEDQGEPIPVIVSSQLSESKKTE